MGVKRMPDKELAFYENTIARALMARDKIDLLANWLSDNGSLEELSLLMLIRNDVEIIRKRVIRRKNHE